MTKKSTCDCSVIHKEVVENVKQLMPEDDDILALADLYKMFSDSTRVKILWALKQSEMCVCDLAVLLDLTKSAISHQLKSLRLSNLVKYRKAAQIVYYSLADDHIGDIFESGFDHINE